MKKLCPVRRLKYRFGIYKKRRRSSAILKFIAMLTILFSLLSCILYRTEKRIGELSEHLALSQIENTISYKCNLFFSEVINENNIDTSSLISVSYDGSKISSLTADFSELNFIKAKLAERVTSYINETDTVICYIPSGSLFSNNILSGIGFKIPTKLIISGSAFVDYSNSFSSAGINQTKYTVALKTTVCAEVQTVFNTFQKVIITEIPICEKILQGDVPTFITD